MKLGHHRVSLAPRPLPSLLQTLTAFWIATVLVAGPVAGAPPAGFQNELVASFGGIPTSVAFLPDGRLLVLDKGGTIWIADPSTLPVVPAPYLTLGILTQ